MLGKRKIWAMVVLMVPWCMQEARAESYTTMDLSALCEFVPLGAKLNDNGAVVGFKYKSEETPLDRALLFAAGTCQDLGTLPDIRPPVTNPWYEFSSVAAGINSLGTIVGESDFSSEDLKDPEDGTLSVKTIPFIMQDGVMRGLGLGKGNFGRARSINDLGVLAGFFDTPYVPGDEWSQYPRAFFAKVSASEISVLSKLEKDVMSMALAINNKNEVVGVSMGSPVYPDPDTGGSIDLTERAVLWKGATVRALPGLEGQAHSRAKDINDRSEAVGYSATSPYYETGSTHKPVIWSIADGSKSPKATELAYPGSATHLHANAINNCGEVISSGSYLGTRVRPVVWRNGEAILLDQQVNLGQGRFLAEGLDINNRGQILLTVFHVADWSYHLHLLTPVAGTPGDVDCRMPTPPKATELLPARKAKLVRAKERVCKRARNSKFRRPLLRRLCNRS